MLKYFRGAPLKIYLHEYLTHENFHTRKFPDLRYSGTLLEDPLNKGHSTFDLSIKDKLCGPYRIT